MTSETLSGAVTALRHTATALAEAGTRMHRHDPGARAFGGDGPGRLGDLGRALHQQFQAALDARGREVAAHAARVEDLADGLVRSAGGYSDVDDTVHKAQQPEVS
jgi:hypothetical protein